MEVNFSNIIIKSNALDVIEHYKEGAFSQDSLTLVEGTTGYNLEDAYINRQMGEVFSRLMKERAQCLPEPIRQRAFRKVETFIECMSYEFSDKHDHLVFDDIDDECISVSFSRRKEMTLDIYFEETDADGSANEAFLSFTANGKRKIINDSIPNIVGVIRQLL